MQAELTELQKKNYIEDSTKCPWCGSIHLTVMDSFFDIENALMHTRCRDCAHEWRDIYKLSDIEIIK